MLNDILGQINDLMYTYLLLFLLLGTGLYFSIRSRFAQVRLMKEGFRILTEKAEVEDGKRQVSSFQALMISTASRVGTGWKRLPRRSFLLYGEGAWKTLDGSAFFGASDHLFCLWIQWSAVL